MTPLIIINGAKAMLKGASPRFLEECLTFMDPKAYFNRAYKERRWDGKVRLHEGITFPAGLAWFVAQHIEKAEGVTVEITNTDAEVEFDLSDVTPDYLGGLGPDGDSALWDSQMEAIHAFLAHPRCAIEVPTSGGKTAIMGAVAKKYLADMGWRTLVVVPRKGLARQTVQEFRTYKDFDQFYVGQCGDGLREIGEVTVATAQTLIKFRAHYRGQGAKRKLIPADAELLELLTTVEVLLLDECHMASSPTWLDIAQSCGARRRHGLSGTPLKAVVLDDMRMVGATGRVVYTSDVQEHIARGISAKPKIAMVLADNASGPVLPKVAKEYIDEVTGAECIKLVNASYEDAYKQGVVENEHLKRAVVRATEWLVDRGRKTLILCRRKAHFKSLEAGFAKMGWPYAALWGDTELDVRDEAKADFNAGHLKAILATTIFDVGENIRGIEAQVMAEGVKTPVNTLQRIGRGMRMTAAGDVWVVDFIPTCHPKLMEHGLERAKAYESKGHEVIVVEDWPKMDDPTPDDLLPFERWDEEYAE